MNPYISLLSIFFGFLLGYYNWNMNRKSVYLSGFIIIIALYTLIHYYLLMGDSVFWLAILYNNTAPLLYLAGPLLFFYVRGTLSDRTRLTNKDWFHLIPSTINLVSIIPYLLKPFTYKLDLAQKLIDNPLVARSFTVGLYPNAVNAVARPILLGIYCIACIVLVFQFSSKMKNNEYIPKKQSRIVLKWLVVFLAIIVTITVNFTYVTFLFWGETNPDVPKLSTGVSMFIVDFCLLMIPISLISFPEILYGIPEVARSKKHFSVNLKPTLLERSSAKNEIKDELAVEESTLITEQIVLTDDTDPKFIDLSQSILDYIKQSEIYLNPNFSMEELSRAMNVPKHHLYYCFASVLKIKLTKLRAELRVAYAKKLIEAGVLDTLTIDAVAIKAGFSSRSSFQSNFKDEVGISPGEYQKNISLKEFN